MLVGAMRVAAGQFHIEISIELRSCTVLYSCLAFCLFGRSILVERIYDLVFKQQRSLSRTESPRPIAENGLPFARRSSARFGCLAAYWDRSLPRSYRYCFFLTGLVVLSRSSTGEARSWRVLAAGGIAGLTALFRYDVGFALTFADLCSIVIAAFLRS